MANIFRCSICGEKFENEVEFCPGCGADKTNFVNINSAENTVQEENNEKEAPKVSAEKKIKQQKKTETVDKAKTVSVTKLVYLVVGLLFFASIILVSSGIFDKPAYVQSADNMSADPNNPHAGHNLNQLEEINTLQKTVDANPNDMTSLVNLAHLLNDSGFKEKAIERYEQYLKMNPRAADVWVDMGVCFYELGKNEEAISKMEKALTIEPKHQIAHLNLGIVNLSSGNKEKAQGWWKKALEINPTSEIGKRAQELINQH
ncbi:MAG: TPR repeat-containing protein [Ignavibacteria bacterium]|nr:MAG: TPR repeat-containing protein [Ignavibacteria bacterium]KAF0155200.1 MAG: TPR repeat-containing protein [Ignavibacteria bacterium]